MRYLDRYLAGEYVQVWRELVELGARVLEEPLRTEAMLVCDEIVRRARFNLRMLHSRLLDFGYEFADPSRALKERGPDGAHEVEKIEQEFGQLPLIARVWYRTFASVNFCQSKQQQMLSQGVRPPRGPDVFGLGSHPVLIFQSFDDCRSQRQWMDADEQEHLRHLKEIGREEPALPNATGQFFPLGGVASYGDAKGFTLPCLAIDGIIHEDREPDKMGSCATCFVDELRFAFRWGGFPFWRFVFVDPDFYSPMEYRPNFEKLLPLLKEGLLEL